MRKFVGRLRCLGFPLFAACASVAACSSSPDPSEPDLAARLERDTGTPWTVYVDPRSHDVRFLAPATPVQIGSGSPEEKARAFFSRYKDALHATGRSDEIGIVSTRTDHRGGIHVRFDHYLPGTTLPVFGAGSTAHFTPDGSVYWLQTDFRADLANVDPASNLPADVATATAIAHVEASCGAGLREPTASGAELGVFADPEAKAALAYRVQISAQTTVCTAPSVFVDAKSGAVLEMLERAQSIDSPPLNGSSYYRIGGNPYDQKVIDMQSLSDSALRYSMTSASDDPRTRTVTFSYLNTSRPIETTNPAHWDEGSSANGAAVDAHFNVRTALVFLRRFEGEHEAHLKPDRYPLGFDVQVIVHDNRLSKGANASADFEPLGGSPFAEDVVRFGDGIAPTNPPTPGDLTGNPLPFSAAYDVVAHELTHLITTHTSALAYKNESGALNESFSDVMAAAAEHARFPDDRKNFTIGEDLYLRGLPGRKALRSMTAPKDVNPGDPDHKDGEKVCPPGVAPSDGNDACGVHSNSGIPNRAFSLIVNGGSLTKLTPAPVVRPIGVPSGIGWDQATELTYWATTGLSSNATFENAALAQIAEALRTPDPVRATNIVSCAWYAVGVFVPRTDLERGLLDAFCKPPAAPPPPAPGPPPGGSGITGTNPCAGHGDAFVCDATVPWQAIVCRNGAPAVPPATAFCADPTQVCKAVSGTDATAVVQDGVLVCE